MLGIDTAATTKFDYRHLPTLLTAGGSLLLARVGVVREGYRSTQLNLSLLAATGCWQGLGRGVLGIDTATTKFDYRHLLPILSVTLCSPTLPPHPQCSGSWVVLECRLRVGRAQTSLEKSKVKKQIKKSVNYVCVSLWR